MEGFRVRQASEAVSNECIAVCDLPVDIECAGAMLQKPDYFYQLPTISNTYSEKRPDMSQLCRGWSAEERPIGRRELRPIVAAWE
jgi:hypothetical protein